jgi:hypothetical protein
MARNSVAAWPHWAALLWVVYAILLAAALEFASPLTQDPAYHQFADTRSLLGIPRFGDVASNLALLAGGLAGLAAVWRRAPTRSRAERGFFGVFFAAVTLTALGSAYYHWAPDSARLVWDRLPLSLVAASFPALVLADRTPIQRAQAATLGAWLALGPASVLLWWLGDGAGAGDLRAYTLLKLVSVLGSGLLLAILPPRHSLGRWYGIAIGLYVLASLCELADRQIFLALVVVSGHTLKHLLSGAAVLGLAWMLARREARG